MLCCGVEGNGFCTVSWRASGVRPLHVHLSWLDLLLVRHVTTPVCWIDGVDCTDGRRSGRTGGSRLASLSLYYYTVYRFLFLGVNWLTLYL